MTSPFFHAPAIAENGGLAILHLKRDHLLPVTLKDYAPEEGYMEGCAVSNTRFGSFPHNTLIGLEWGSQVRASRVDTGTRGRVGKKGKKVVEEAVVEGAMQEPAIEAAVEDIVVGSNEKVQEQVSKKRTAVEADLETKHSGVMKKARHDVPIPTTQTETAGSRKRKSDDMGANSTQVTAKKLKQQHKQQIGAVNGEIAGSLAPAATTSVEAGSGFIHLLPPTPEAWTYSLDHRTQVVYTADYSYILQRLRIKPGDTMIEAGAGSGSFTHAAARAVFNGYPNAAASSKKRKLGKVYSYEYHETRAETLQQELSEHGMNGVVHLTHRDVCTDGFLLPPTPPETDTSTSPKANAIFLDLPAPWLALKHLTRTCPSPLNPTSPIHLCTFSPCIEQVIATVSALRKAGWTDIHMLEVANRRIDVRREQVGLKNEGLRGVNSSAATVAEAVGRLREVEGKMGEWAAAKSNGSTDPIPTDTAKGDLNAPAEAGGKKAGKKNSPWKDMPSKAERLEKLRKAAENRKVYKEGNLVHRTEAEVKTHTSYLVFAVLPREWSEEDEVAAMGMWGVDGVMRVEKAGGGGDSAVEEDL